MHRVGLHAHEQARLLAGVEAVVEFCDLPLAQCLAKGPEAARLFRNCHSDDRLALLAQLGPLGHMAQAVEIDVGPGVDGHQGLSLHTFTRHVLLDTGHGQGPGRLGDRTGVVVDILDRRAQFVTAHRHHLVDEVAAQLEAMGADLRHRHTIGKGADLRQDHAFADGHGSLQAVGIHRFDADHLHVRAQVLHVGGDTGDQAATAHGHKDSVQRPRALT